MKSASASSSVQSAVPAPAFTLPGAVFLALISVLPDFLIRWFNTPFYFGGTSLLIVVGVALDTVRQMESHLLMRNYEGFLKRRARVHA